MTLCLKQGSHQDLPLSELKHYPLLKELGEIWHRLAGPRPPAQLDPTLIPPRLLPYVMVLEHLPISDTLRVRLAGTEVCAHHGMELRGKTLDEIFRDSDISAVMSGARAVIDGKRPSLAQRDCVTVDDRGWSYTRLLLPLSRDGTRVDRLVKTLDPASLRY